MRREERLPDCRMCRRDPSVTYASSHPELIYGDLVMRPRVPVSLTSAERESIAKWSRGYLIAVILVAIVVLLPTLRDGSERILAVADETTASFAQTP